MFKKFGMMLLAACFMLPVQAKAADLLGVYVTPKFALSVQHFKGVAIDLDGDEMPGTDSKNSACAGGALAIGYDFSKKFDIPLRAEVEYGAYGNASQQLGFADAEAGDAMALKHTVGFQTLLANVYWDITTWNKFTPYVGAGIGMAFVKTEADYAYTSTKYSEDNESGSFSDTKTVFAGQIGLGCSYAFNDYISADLGYRFLMMDDAKASMPDVSMKSKDLYAHQFTLGVRVTF